jgi:hypothetical protein
MHPHTIAYYCNNRSTLGDIRIQYDGVVPGPDMAGRHLVSWLLYLSAAYGTPPSLPRRAPSSSAPEAATS